MIYFILHPFSSRFHGISSMIMLLLFLLENNELTPDVLCSVCESLSC